MKLKTIKTTSALLIVLFNLVACGADDKESYDITEQPLSGSIAGQDWTFAHGRAREDADDNSVFITMFDVEVEDPCGEPSGDDADRPQILMIRDAEVGASELSLNKNMTFTFRDPDGQIQNHVGVQGTWRFDEVNDETISGGLNARAGEHEVDGTFELTVCPDPFANF